MKCTIWTVACGGYKTAGARVFTNKKEAEEYMKAEYEDQIEVSGIEDTSMCYIDDEYAEPYDENMSFDDVFVFQLEEHEIEIPDDSFSKSNTSDEPKIYQLLREDAKYGTDISMTFTAKNHEEAKRYAHILAIKALQNEYNNNPNADWEEAWISFYEGSSGDDYRIVAGIDLDNISDTLNYNVTYTLHELDSVKDCKHTASITEEENKLLNLTYKINKDGIFETDMKTVFEMLKNGVTLEEITNKINDLLDD